MGKAVPLIGLGVYYLAAIHCFMEYRVRIMDVVLTAEA
jgi:hypothetical protein